MLRDPRLRRAGPLARRGDAAPAATSTRSAIWSRTPENAQALAAQSGHDRRRLASRRRSTAPTSSCTATNAREPIVRREWLGPGAHVNAVGSSIPTTRELDTRDDRRRGAVRRPPRVDRERGRRLPLRRSRGRDRRPTTSAPSSARCCSAPRRAAASDDEMTRVQVARPRRRGPRRRRARATGARASRGSASRSSSDPARRDPARARDDRRRGRAHAARPALLPEAPAEIWLKLENLQPIGSFKIRGATNAIRQAPARGDRARRGDRERREHGAGRRLGGARGGRAVHRRRARARAADEARRDRAARRARGQGAVRATGGRRSRSRAFDGVEGLFVHPVADERVMAGNGTIGLELLEDLPDLDAVFVPFGGGGLVSGIASAVKALRPETRVVAVEPETRRAARGLARAPARRARSSTGRRSSTAPARRPCSPRCGRALRELVDDAVVGLARGGRRGGAPARRAGARDRRGRGRARARGGAAASRAAAIVCIVSGGNIDASRLAEILAGRVPD